MINSKSSTLTKISKNLEVFLLEASIFQIKNKLWFAYSVTTIFINSNILTHIKIMNDYLYQLIQVQY